MARHPRGEYAGLLHPRRARATGMLASEMWRRGRHLLRTRPTSRRTQRRCFAPRYHRAMRHNPVLSLRFLVAYSVLALFLHELHELAHTATGRLICGAWGTRDFNLWRLADGCVTYLPTVMGPLFSYLVMFAGIVLASSDRLRYLGVALALAPNPFARLFTALMGGGDEMVLGRVLAGSGKTPALRIAIIIVVAALTLPPMIAAWRALSSTSRRGVAFIVLLLAPMVLTGVLYFVIGNRLLAAGVLTQPRVLGDPLLVFLTTFVTATATLLTNRWIRFPRQGDLRR